MPRTSGWVVRRSGSEWRRAYRSSRTTLVIDLEFALTCCYGWVAAKLVQTALLSSGGVWTRPTISSIVRFIH